MRDAPPSVQPDVPYRIRQFVQPWLTRLARALGQPEYRLWPTEYVGTVHCRMDDLVAELRAHGFSWGPISWYHQPPVGIEPNGSWTYRPSVLSDRQLHVVLVAHAPEYIDIYAHEEYNWLRHPVKHGQQVGIRRQEGARTMRRWLDQWGLAVTDKSPTRRKLVRLGHRIRDRLTAGSPVTTDWGPFSWLTTSFPSSGTLYY